MRVASTKKDKTCAVCHTTRPATLEFFCKNGPYLHSRCRQCFRDRGQQWKRQVFEHYGLVCICCGETHFEFLSIDHVLGGGRQHLAKLHVGNGGSAFYGWLIRQGFPPGYETRCMNCNSAIGHYGYCPHHPEIRRPVWGRRRHAL